LKQFRLALAGILLVIAGVLCIPFDLTLVKLADGTALRGDARRVLDLAEAFAFGPSAIVVALGVVLADGRPKRFMARLFAYPILTGLLANLAKLAIPRLRPRGLPSLFSQLSEPPTGWDTFLFLCPAPSIAKLGDGSSSIWQSFPSAHAVTAVGLAIGLARLYPKARWYFATLAIFAGMQRVFANAHYPSDVLVGAGFAMLICWAFERMSRWSLANSNPEAERCRPYREAEPNHEAI
jgi:membrane-associated phospholipid phosphatase